MAAKFVVVLAALAVAHCSVVPVARVDADYTSFAYDVADPHTGDFKSQVETRVGGNVVGQYSLLDADGTKRTVDYVADDVNGFNAVVRKDPAVVATPVVASAPAVVAARTVAAPAVVATRTIAAPTVYAAAAPVVAARTVAAPYTYTYAAGTPVAYSAASPLAYTAYGTVAGVPSVVAARTVAGPTYVARSYAPSYYAASPLSYAAYSSPVSYW